MPADPPELEEAVEEALGGALIDSGIVPKEVPVDTDRWNEQVGQVVQALIDSGHVLVLSEEELVAVLAVAPLNEPARGDHQRHERSARTKLHAARCRKQEAS